MVYTYSWNSGLIPGSPYQFKIQAKNGAGSGAFSSVLTVVASSSPNKMNTVTVTMALADTSALISWSYPVDNGDSVKEYSIQI